MQELRVTNFDPLIAQCSTAIDGGAGAGDTARQMIAAGIKHVDAFEPFPGNHRFFDDDPRIMLHASALGSKNGLARFEVPDVVRPNTTGWEGREGYSSLGRLKSWSPSELKRVGRQHVLKVDVVKADDVVKQADFIKLDLQGGERDALMGMSRLLQSAKVLWIEFAGDFRILDLLDGFELYTTELLFLEWTAWHDNNLEKSQVKSASTGVPFYFGWHGNWRNFHEEWKVLSSKSLIQTDIVAVRSIPNHLKESVF